MRRRSRFLVVLTFVVLVLALPGVAFAAWKTTGAGSGYARAPIVSAGNKPTATVSGRNVTVSWAASTAGSASVSLYKITRYDSATHTAQTIGSTCSGTVSGLTCTEAAVAPGSWQYTVTPKIGLWSGAEGPSSTAAVVGSPSLSWTSSTTVNALPSTLTGSLGSYLTGETVTFRLDNQSTGTVLSGSITPSPVGNNGAPTFSVTIPSGVSCGSHTVYAVGSLGSVASGTITVAASVDTTAPTVSAAVVAKSTGNAVGYIHQGGTYYVYANATDSGACVSGVATVTADVSAVTTGATATALTSGSYTAGGVSYSYRSALLTANAALAAGAKAFTVRAVDGSGNAVTQGGFSVTVDNTAPAASDVQTTNAGTLGTPETGDTLILTYSEQIDPGSIISGWNGSATTVTLHLDNTNPDTVTIYNSTNTVQLPLGSVDLANNNYTTANVTFTGSTMVQSGATITITLGTASGAGPRKGGASRMVWTPSTTATDLAGNPCSATAVTESGTNDRNF